jgi:hypothetical protein
MGAEEGAPLGKALNWNRAGRNRLIIAVSIVWMAAFYLATAPHINLWFKYLAVTPNTTCAQAFDKRDSRLIDCEYVTPGWAENFTRVRRGDSAPFGVYWDAVGRPNLIFLWLGVPFLLFAIARLVEWVVAGFKRSEST